ncbi:hypothetical protein; putative Glycerate kinase [Frankia alni ACN14a]|uniref:Uncharacterized protein n=2 Tax=Frankiaceae TaxID=74712 RepID=Q0RD13_FRAAA|nr:hypothetical protein; putative Glycerate kinase [Frankia alni ACN14a]
MDQAGTEIARPRGYRPGPSAMGAVVLVAAAVEASVVLGKAALGSPALGASLMADVRVLAACRRTEAQGTGAPAAGVSGTVLGLVTSTAIVEGPAGEPTRRFAVSGNPRSAVAQAAQHADRHLISGSARDPLPD